MERIDRILAHPKYREYCDRIAILEQNRIFCHHDSVHFLNVARIGWILNLEEQTGLSKEMIYTAALLHDIGRFKQYEDGSDHALVSAELAVEILEDCGYYKEEQSVIIEAIKSHRTKEIAGERSLRGVLYRADKLSRDCYFCRVNDQCDWKKDKKNKVLRY